MTGQVNNTDDLVAKTPVSGWDMLCQDQTTQFFLVHDNHSIIGRESGNATSMTLTRPLTNHCMLSSRLSLEAGQVVVNHGCGLLLQKEK